MISGSDAWTLDGVVRPALKATRPSKAAVQESLMSSLQQEGCQCMRLFC